MTPAALHARHPLVRPAARGRRQAFTLIELLVVISLFAILLGVAVPAFSSLIQASEESMADSQLRAGLGAGRDAAVRSDSGDGAAVFFFDPGGRIRIVPCVQVGTITDVREGASPTSTSAGDLITRDVFAPLPLVKPIELPKGWMVRGLVPAGRLQRAGSTIADQTTGWYEPIPTATGGARVFEDPVSRPNWVFPETGFYDFSRGDRGSTRQTFMVRYARGSGTVSLVDQRPALVIDPVPALKFHEEQTPWKDFRVDKAVDMGMFAKRVLAPRSEPKFGSTKEQQQATRIRLLGDAATDTVLAGPVTTLALYQEKRLVQGIGARGINRLTGTLYGKRDLAKGDVIPTEPIYDNQLVQPLGSPDQVTRRINEWIQGRKVTGMPEGSLQSDARLYTVTRYLGQAREITP